MKINTTNYPNLLNLLTLPEVIPGDTTVETIDGDIINLTELINRALGELK